MEPACTSLDAVILIIQLNELLFITRGLQKLKPLMVLTAMQLVKPDLII